MSKNQNNQMMPWSIDHKDLCDILLTDTGVPGTFCVAITWHFMPSPIAMVWYRGSARPNELEIVNSWTDARARRQGLRTRLNTLLFHTYPQCNRLVTQMGTEDGRAFMENRAYTKHKDGWWSVTRNAWNRRLK